MKLPEIKTVTSADEARNLAIDWSNSNQDENYSYGELIDWSSFFTALAVKFDLTDEFKENGII